MSGLQFDYVINPNFSGTINMDPALEKILSSNDGFEFHRSLPGYEPTPLYSLPGLANDLGIGELWIKDESKRFGLNTFKGLGASYAVYTYLKEHPGKHMFCTATDGNHGRALAWICNIFKQKCTVFVPGYTIRQRIKAIEDEHATVKIVKGTYDETVAMAKEWSEKSGSVLIQDTSWPDYQVIPATIMQGYLTSFREMEQWLRNEPVDLILIQAGVGSWAASAAWYFNRISDAKLPAIVVVEALETDCIQESIKRDRPTSTSKSRNTILAGLNCGFPSVVAYGILRQAADMFLSIPDQYSIEAMKKLYYPIGNDPQILSGESGAAGLGGLIALSSEDDLQEAKKRIGLNRNSKVLLFNTEGITDSVLFKRLVLDG